VRLARCAFAGKKIKEAHAKVKSGTATEIEVTIVKKMDKGTHPGYVILDENGDMRNAWIHYQRNKHRFLINAGSYKTYRISTGCSELVIGSRHHVQGHTFTVLHPL
jgi:hypothetical protein